MSYELTKKLQSVEAYDPVSAEYAIHLDANESFIDIGSDAPEIAEKIANEIKNVSLNRYPDPKASGPVAAFSEYYGIPTKYITAGNGSDELISLIVENFLEKGDTLLTLSPDFSMYAFYGSLSELKVHAMPKEDNLTVSIPKIVEFCNNNDVKAVIFSNPCNPTSIGISREDIIRLVKNLFCLVIVDEAYMDFWDQSVLDTVSEYDNLIVLKTCSKAMGMAAVRMGFAVACENITNALRTVKSPYNTDTISQIIAKTVLMEKDYLKGCTERIIESRKKLNKALIEFAADYPKFDKVYESVTNFVFIKTAAAQEIADKLAERSISVRRFGTAYLRITAGSDSENEALMKALHEIAAETSEKA